MTTFVAADRVVDLPVERAFALFGDPEAPGWLFGARCDRVVPGAAVSLHLPADGRGLGGDLSILGRFSRVVPGARVEIEHTQPWRGRLVLRFRGVGPRRTRVVVQMTLPPSGVDWLMHRAGIPLPEPDDDQAVRIGALSTMSGAGAVFAASSQAMAELAVAEVNADGGVAGRRLALLTADDATDPDQAAREARRMARLGCRAIFVNCTSASFEAARDALALTDVLLVHSVINEGGGETPRAIRLAERPRTQVEALIAPMMRASGARRWFLVGHSYVWSTGAHADARAAIARAGGHVAGERLAPIGATDFATVIEAVQRSGADLLLSSLNGESEVAFQRQSEAAGLRQTVQAASLVLDESTLSHIGERAAEGLRTALAYFQDGPADGNGELLSRYRSAHGPWAPPITTLSETVYEAIHQYARVLHRDPDGRAEAHARALLTRTSAGCDAVGARTLVAPSLYTAVASRAELHIDDVVTTPPSPPIVTGGGRRSPRSAR